MAENNQYENSQVQPKDFTSGWKIAFIITGTGVTLPILFLGSEIALSIGFQSALVSFGISTFILTVLCAITTLIGNRTRLSTYMILKFSFGDEGAKLINFLIGVSLLGWFSVGLELLAQAMRDTAIETMGISLPMWGIIIFSSLFISTTTIYGIKSIEKLANIIVPLLLVFLAYILYRSLLEISSFSEIWNYNPVIPKMTLFAATSALIGSSIVLPVIMADFSRFIRNDKQSLISVLGITIGFPLVLLVSGITTVQTGEVDIMQIMKAIGFIIPAFILLFFSTWITNATNLYSITLTFSTIIPSWGFKKMATITSIIGTVMALFGFTAYIFDFLNLLGVFIPSVSAIYIVDFFLVKKQLYDMDKIPKWGKSAIISWVISSIVALLTYNEVFLITNAYYIDSFVIGGLVYVFLKRKEIWASKFKIVETA
jgi:cytosine permease